MKHQASTFKNDNMKFWTNNGKSESERSDPGEEVLFLC